MLVFFVLCTLFSVLVSGTLETCARLHGRGYRTLSIAHQAVWRRLLAISATFHTDIASLWYNLGYVKDWVALFAKT